ncbi:tetratricopeptide repeat protein [Chryseobacterium sp. Tr-659]|uniref:tetratricopeptide repeat protein n=1 Tax=Chryseobacterium sp. Tr-659 TaxID=2608340 RepID=UPI00141E09B4|nr:tetratricopeptide repeat protein [Chryseobacterium sp. Tr-659]NIF05925.1 tetratricopeptide repeat protein [Chryseobacterium sp. Tr-659]
MKESVFWILFIPLFLIISCNHNNKESDYFFELGKEMNMYVREDPGKMKKIFYRELNKYHKTGNIKYLISSKQVEMAINSNDKQKQILLCYDLLRLNNNRYTYITINCNACLSAYFEKSSPEWALKYINIAIDTSKGTTKQYNLGHLYHFKGRILYNEGRYNDAISLFKKALMIFEKQDETMYIASMYNNFGLCYEKMNRLKEAITATEKAFKILSAKPNLYNEEKVFLNYIKEGLANYYKKVENFKQAEILFSSELEFSLRIKNFGMVVRSATALINIYDSIDANPSATEHIIKSLEAIEPELRLNENKIILNTALQNYYLKTNNIQNLKIVSQRLAKLNREGNENYKNEIEANLNFTDKYILKSANQESDYEKRKNIFLLLGMLFLIAVFSLILSLLTKMKKKKEEVYAKEKEILTKEKEILTKGKVIYENEKKILEQNILLQKEKINNLHLNLNLKTETEREFLENIKKIKKTKNINIEEVLKNLQLKISNLILIDKKNNDIINESSRENKNFIEKLSKTYPSLSEQELKLCVYFKLNLSAKEISLLEKLSVGSIRVYKTKIKIKMGLGREDNLGGVLEKNLIS